MEAIARVVLRLLQAALFIAVFGLVLCLMKALWLPAAGFLALGAAALFAFLNLRCPRCGEAIGADLRGDKGWDHDPKRGGAPTQGDCTTCGRSRDDVLPFQYVLARERWDGERP